MHHSCIGDYLPPCLNEQVFLLQDEKTYSLAGDTSDTFLPADGMAHLSQPPNDYIGALQFSGAACIMYSLRSEGDTDQFGAYVVVDDVFQEASMSGRIHGHLNASNAPGIVPESVCQGSCRDKLVALFPTVSYLFIIINKANSSKSYTMSLATYDTSASGMQMAFLAKLNMSWHAHGCLDSLPRECTENAYHA